MNVRISAQNAGESNLKKVIGDLLASALKSLDADADASREYLLVARALLGGRAPDAYLRGRVRRFELPRWKEQRVISYIEANLSNEIRISQLARFAGLSCSHFVRAFKSSLGSSPAAFLRRRRIEEAKKMLLTTDRGLAQIALDCGLCDQAHLSRLFRRLVGSTPTQWRKANAVAPYRIGGRRFPANRDRST